MAEPLEFHPFANLFPLIEGAGFDELVADVRENGIREPVVLYELKILDGRNRYRAAVACGLMAPDGTQANGPVSPIILTRRFVPQVEGDPLAFVLSLNLHRRHLSTSQRAMIGAEIAGMKRGRPGDNPQDCGISAAQAAERLNVAPRSIEMARRVREQGADELVTAVKAGSVTVAAASDLASLPKERQREAIRSADPSVLYGVLAEERARKQELKKAAREAGVQKLADKIADGNAALAAAGAGGKRYGVIYADPEWRFEPRSRETGMDRAADNHYPTSSVEEIAARPVWEISASDCALFLWATRPMLPQALKVIEAWGFAYKSLAVWGKRRAGEMRGTGYWFTDECEILILATKGRVPAPAPGAQWPSLFIAPVGRHSAKPDRAYELIEAYFPRLPKVELNARARRPGWDAWGAEAPDHLPDAGEMVALGRPVSAELDEYAAAELPALPLRGRA